MTHWSFVNSSGRNFVRMKTLNKPHFNHHSVRKKFRKSKVNRVVVRICAHAEWMDPQRGHRTAELAPTLEMVNGVLKSRPPTRRKPQGEGPFSVTVWDIVFGTEDCERHTDGQTEDAEQGIATALPWWTAVKRADVRQPESCAWSC